MYVVEDKLGVFVLGFLVFPVLFFSKIESEAPA